MAFLAVRQMPLALIPLHLIVVLRLESVVMRRQQLRGLSSQGVDALVGLCVTGDPVAHANVPIVMGFLARVVSSTELFGDVLWHVPGIYVLRSHPCICRLYCRGTLSTSDGQMR